MWNERYGQREFAYGTEPNDFLKEHAQHLEGPILCLASGEGRNAVWLAERGFSVFAVDGSHEGVRKTQRLATERSVTVRTEVADLAEFDLGRSRWGAIIGIFAHLPPPLRTRVHKAIPDALRPGGTLLMEMYSSRQLGRNTGGPPVLPMLYTESLVREELSDLAFEHLQDVDREVIEGRFHTGRAAVLQVRARRTT